MVTEATDSQQSIPELLTGRPTYPECPNCCKTDDTVETCWRGNSAHLRPKRNKQDAKNPTNFNNEENSF